MRHQTSNVFQKSEQCSLLHTAYLVTTGIEAYLRLAMSGALCNCLVRLLLHPVDNVKTRVQVR
jgi:energy-converting hydrogenase Eha subunit C